MKESEENLILHIYAKNERAILKLLQDNRDLDITVGDGICIIKAMEYKDYKLLTTLMKYHYIKESLEDKEDIRLQEAIEEGLGLYDITPEISFVLKQFLHRDEDKNRADIHQKLLKLEKLDTIPEEQTVILKRCINTLVKGIAQHINSDVSEKAVYDYRIEQIAKLLNGDISSNADIDWTDALQKLEIELLGDSTDMKVEDL